MNEPKLAPRILACLFGAVIVVVVAVYFRPPSPESITLGTLATKDSNHSTRPVRVSNASQIVRHGRYLVYDSKATTRYPVVFTLRADAAVPVNCTVFRGTCEGIFRDPFPGCPAVPPFVYVSDAVPVTDGD